DRNVTGVQTCALPILVHRPWHHGCEHGGQSAEGGLRSRGARCAAPEREPPYSGRRAMGSLAPSRGRGLRGRLPLAPRTAGGRGRSEERRVGKEGRSVW